MGRHQSSLQKQLETLNSYFHELCGEPLATKRDRGQDYAFTPTGERVAEEAKALLLNWHDILELRRREVGRRLVVATTTFTLPILAVVWNQVLNEVATSVDLRVVQIRTKDFFERLDKRGVDVVVGGFLGSREGLPDLNYDFLEWNRDRVVLLTNLDKRNLPMSSLTTEDLKQYDVVAPDAGVIRDVLHFTYGESFEQELKLLPPVQDLYYGINLLRYGFVSGLMFATETAAKHALRLTASDDVLAMESSQLPTPPINLRTINLGEDFKELVVVSGLFARKGEREYYERNDPGHPLAVLWRVFEEHRREHESP